MSGLSNQQRANSENIRKKVNIHEASIGIFNALIIDSVTKKQLKALLQTAESRNDLEFKSENAWKDTRFCFVVGKEKRNTELAALKNGTKETAKTILECWDNIDARMQETAMGYHGPSDSWRLLCGSLVYCVRHGGGIALAGLKQLIDRDMKGLCPPGVISQAPK